jgi:tRNA pseudouridine38-40 synthase
MRRLKLLLAYDGRPWRGWQSQIGKDAVQDQLEAVFEKITGAKACVQGSGRTDAGVHARGQVAHVDVPADARLIGDGWLGALNAHLPPSIRVLECEELGVNHSFHARFDAKGKIYQYRIWRGAVMSPFELGFAWHVWGALDMDVLRQGTQLFRGTHNFSRLSANRGDIPEDERRSDTEGMTRTIQRLEAKEKGSLLELEFEGEGFLYKMVRIMTGSLIHAARGRASVDWLRELVADSSGDKSHHCAPADGLFLVRVLY